MPFKISNTYAMCSYDASWNSRSTRGIRNSSGRDANALVNAGSISEQQRASSGPGALGSAQSSIVSAKSLAGTNLADLRKWSRTVLTRMHVSQLYTSRGYSAWETPCTPPIFSRTTPCASSGFCTLVNANRALVFLSPVQLRKHPVGLLGYSLCRKIPPLQVGEFAVK